MQRFLNIISGRNSIENNQSFYGVKEIQLVNFTGKPINICVNSHIVLTGELYEIDTGVAKTKVGMGVLRVDSLIGADQGKICKSYFKL